MVEPRDVAEQGNRRGAPVHYLFLGLTVNFTSGSRQRQLASTQAVSHPNFLLKCHICMKWKPALLSPWLLHYQPCSPYRGWALRVGVLAGAETLQAWVIAANCETSFPERANTQLSPKSWNLVEVHGPSLNQYDKQLGKGVYYDSTRAGSIFPPWCLGLAGGEQDVPVCETISFTSFFYKKGATEHFPWFRVGVLWRKTLLISCCCDHTPDKKWPRGTRGKNGDRD